MLKKIINNLLPVICGVFLVFPELGAALVAAELDAPIAETYDFIRLLPGGRFEAIAAQDDALNPEAAKVSGFWGEIDEGNGVNIKLVDEVSGRDEILKLLPRANLSTILGRNLITDRVEEISDLGPLNFRAITLLANGRFVATAFSDGHRIVGTYERGLKPVYDRDEDSDQLDHVLMDALEFKIGSERVIMTLSVAADGSLTLEDPMAYGNYPTYR